jgi:hypothetical protein
LALRVLMDISPAHAQPAATSFEQLRDRVVPGDVIYVTDTTGRTAKEAVGRLTSSTLQLAGRESVLTEQDVRKISVERNDPPWRGALIGLAAAGGPWLALCAPHDWCYYNEYGGEDLYRRLALVTTGLAAGIGALIDLSIKERVPVYSRPGSAWQNLQISPLLSTSSAGLRLSARF